MTPRTGWVSSRSPQRIPPRRFRNPPDAEQRTAIVQGTLRSRCAASHVSPVAPRILNRPLEPIVRTQHSGRPRAPHLQVQLTDISREKGISDDGYIP